MPKLDHYIAIRDTEPKGPLHTDIRLQMWDMLRYDRCYPISNSPDGWIVLMQPYRDGVNGGFTRARWDSFGFRAPDVVVGSSVRGFGLPLDMREALRR